MAIFHHPLLVMSLSGSLVMALYGLTYPLARRWFPRWWRRRVLVLALFFYLAPVPLLRDWLRDRVNNWAYKHIPAAREGFLKRDLFGVVDPGYTINMQTNTVGGEVIFVRVVVLLLGVMAAVVVIRQLWRYIAVYRGSLSRAFLVEAPPALEEAFRELKKEMGIKRPVRLVCSRLCQTPLTIGVVVPAVIFPPAEKLELGEEDCRCVLKHELLHIKRLDLPIKFLTLFAVALHWYNPICWMMYHELCVVSELDCDYGVIKGFTEVQRCRYGDLILDLAVAGAGSRKERLTVGLTGGGAAAFQRRILEIQQTARGNRAVLAGVMGMAFCALGTMTAFAYQTPQFYESANEWRKYEVVFYESTLHDSFRIGPRGEVIPYDFGPEQAGCSHNFHDATFTEHKTNGEGGCVMRGRQAHNCDLCGYEEIGELISEEAYEVCPHEGEW